MNFLKNRKVTQPVEAIIGEGVDYNLYNASQKEKIIWFLIGLIVSGAVLYIFYESILVSIIAGAICGVVFVPLRRNQVIKKRQKTLTAQFRGLLDALSTSIGAGKNMFDSFSGAAEDLSVQFSSEAFIVK